MKTQHLVFLTEHLSYGGAEVVLVEYLQGIDLSKYDATLVIRDDLGDKNFLLSSIPTGIQVIHLFGAEEVSQKIHVTSSFRKLLVARLKDILAKIDAPKIIIDFSPVLDKVTSKFKNENVILWMHGDKSHMGFMERTKYLLRIRHYKRIVVLCEEMREQMESLFPSLKRKLYIIPNPFNFDRIRTGANDINISATDQELMKNNYVVSVARLVPGKDFQTVIRAAKILKDRGIKYTHYIIGDGNLKNELQSLIDTFNLNDTIHLLGARKNPYPWIKNSLFFVHSAHREGFGLVIVEAMSLGKAVIASRCPVGPAEILGNGAYGKIYPMQDSIALADLIEEFLANPAEVVAFKEKSLQRANDFSIQNILPKLYKLLEEFE
ncbi:glycosyltransferase [Bdellovibrio svalbardensis]|uniref:Glycosyltransferase n=1 Tax=Bdellovibrio svalbardensis TaxID=2972972 RepID=A0ABT6DKG1_9BACT|nr:glycosyltransferase [Bdellovibrio svalbardensis]MDG0817361.1 glycosyltransferase [Bdellovibrio svalbardensis]